MLAFLSKLEFVFLYGLQGLHTPAADRFMVWVSSLGNSGWFFILLGIALLCFKRTRKIGLAVLLSLLAGLLIGNIFLKNAVMRARPCWMDETVRLLIAVPHDYSFPSGHSLASFETAVSVYLYSRRWGAVLLVLAVIIAFSRMYLFVHFPSDVLAGALLGILIAGSVHRILEKQKKCDIL